MTSPMQGAVNEAELLTERAEVSFDHEPDKIRYAGMGLLSDPPWMPLRSAMHRHHDKVAGYSAGNFQPTLVRNPGCAKLPPITPEERERLDRLVVPPNLTPGESGPEHWPVFHEPGCAAIPSDGAEPQMCTCGVSPRFKLFGYDVPFDLIRWRECTRETLVKEAVWVGVSKAQGHSLNSRRERMPRTVVVGRAVKTSLHAVELQEIYAAWDSFWNFSDMESRDLSSYGVPDVAAAMDLSPLPARTRDLLAMTPSEAEIKATLKPWLDHWAQGRAK